MFTHPPLRLSASLAAVAGLAMVSCRSDIGSQEQAVGELPGEASAVIEPPRAAVGDLSPTLRDQRILVSARLAVAVDERVDLRDLRIRVQDGALVVQPARPLTDTELGALREALGAVDGVADIRIDQVEDAPASGEGSVEAVQAAAPVIDASVLVALADPDERLPDPEPPAEGSASAPAAAASGDRPRTYRVRAGDSLSRIAARTMNDGTQWRRLYEFNRAVIGSNPERLREGMELRIPQD